VSDHYVYIMTNNSGTLYVGVTNNLERRDYEHTQGVGSGFTKRYGLTRLVYYETTPDVRAAIQREKEIKGWVRRKKIALIASTNPYWRDLSEVWTGEIETLRGVYPERCFEILRFAQNDRERRTQGDR
jgi:putative endonuclease